MPRTSSIGARRRGDAVGERRPPPRAARVTSAGTRRGGAERRAQLARPRVSASETTAITIAFRGPIFMNVCGAADGVDPHGGDQLVRLERVALHAGDEVEQRDAAHAAHRRALDLRVVEHQRRQRVAGRRGGGEVAAERAAVANLRRADGARGLGERRQKLGQLRRIASVYVSPRRVAASRSRATSRAARRPRSG